MWAFTIRGTSWSGRFGVQESAGPAPRVQSTCSPDGSAPRILGHPGNRASPALGSIHATLKGKPDPSHEASPRSLSNASRASGKSSYFTPCISCNYLNYFCLLSKEVSIADDTKLGGKRSGFSGVQVRLASRMCTTLHLEDAKKDQIFRGVAGTGILRGRYALSRACQKRGSSGLSLRSLRSLR